MLHAHTFERVSSWKPHSSVNFLSMASPQTLKARAEHKLPVEDKTEKRLKLVQRAQWLRAAILGANDGLLSTTSLMLGVGAAKEDQRSMILSGLAGAVAGACSMALGEFVSVSTQRDIEKATVCHTSAGTEPYGHGTGGDIKLHITTSAKGTTIIETNPGRVDMALSPALTPSRCKRLGFDGEGSLEKVSPAMTPHEQDLTPERKSPLAVSSAKSPVMRVIASDAKTATAQGQGEANEKQALPNPYKAAAASAMSFLGGSVVPLVPAVLVVHNTSRVVAVVAATSVALAFFGVTGAYLGGSPIRASAVRVLLGGWISMALTYVLLKPLDKDGKGHDSD